MFILQLTALTYGQSLHGLQLHGLLLLGKGQLPSAQTLLVVTNIKFGANEIGVTFVIKLNVGTTSTQ